MAAEQRRAVITGVTGQDGSFLAELLLQREYEVVGLTRRAEQDHLGSSEHLRHRIRVVHAPTLSDDAVRAVLHSSQPHELYHLAAPTFVPDSWRHPGQTMAAIIGSATAILEAVPAVSPHTRVFFASTGGIFGDTSEFPQTEDSFCRPRNPYATAKLAAHQLVAQLRGHTGLFVCSGILYNHESERRPETFVTRKVSRGVAAIKLGLANSLVLGSLDSVRDWSFAGDVMAGAWLMLQQEQPRDYILASGVGRTVADFVTAAFGCAGLDPERFLRIDQTLVRTPEATPPVGDPTRAEREIGWRRTYDFDALVERMVTADVADLKRLS